MAAVVLVLLCCCFNRDTISRGGVEEGDGADRLLWNTKRRWNRRHTKNFMVEGKRRRKILSLLIERFKHAKMSKKLGCNVVLIRGDCTDVYSIDRAKSTDGGSWV